MTVNMPVEVLNERCVNCPDLEVDTITHENYDILKVDEDGSIQQVNKFESRLRCTHCDECRLRYETVFKEPEQKPKKPTRAAARKKQASK